MLKILFFSLFFFQPLLAKNPKNQLLDITEFYFADTQQTTDSGHRIDAKILKKCLKDQRATYIELSCDELTSKYHISSFKEKNKATYVLIIKDGVSVENRVVLRMAADKSSYIRPELWPKITDEKIAELINKKTGKKTITATGVTMSAQSSYRTHPPKDGSNIIPIHAGDIGDIGDIGVIGYVEWTGRTFVLRN